MCLRVKGVSTNNDPRTTGAKAGMSPGSCNVCPLHMGHGLQGLIQVGKEVFRREGGHHLGAGTLSKMAEHQVK